MSYRPPSAEDSQQRCSAFFIFSEGKRNAGVLRAACEAEKHIPHLASDLLRKKASAYPAPDKKPVQRFPVKKIDKSFSQSYLLFFFDVFSIEKKKIFLFKQNYKEYF